MVLWRLIVSFVIHRLSVVVRFVVFAPKEHLANKINCMRTTAKATFNCVKANSTSKRL
ncbi:predicted protein [Pyrenophora tritici-repentis Pt-1C-BFP]|uniref:Uncharacterized protein n=1 Tax=Pyrenophora tritici-repentis (strain Pt-1C-BFP) TaxID=426418 RepID=B2WA35_PYRTR|nr:uncharacterized protein PTRG_06843 [Pyrenophora tritici-repentis Pt-1C-BFP]EDU49763.1 predicted protein [Pyrenophora tritici-repentis Pt-1C-BFP]